MVYHVVGRREILFSRSDTLILHSKKVGRRIKRHEIHRTSAQILFDGHEIENWSELLQVLAKGSKHALWDQWCATICRCGQITSVVRATQEIVPEFPIQLCT